MKRTLNGVTIYYVYDGEKPVLEYNSSGTIVGRNLYGKAIDEILLRVDVANNWTLYYQQDHEGSVTHLTNSSGAVIEKYRYDAFGAPTIYNPSNTQLSTSAYNNRFLFTGREYAATFSFYEYRTRAYNPTLGRFMSEDPKLFDAGDYNLYRYCHNDPEDLTDPKGLGVDVITTIPPNPFFQREMDASRLAVATAAQRAFQALAKLKAIMAQTSRNASTALDRRLDRFGIPAAIGKVEQFAEKFTKRNPQYDGQGIAGALKEAQSEGRIIVGQSKDFRGKDNPFTTYDDIIHVNLDSHPRGSIVPALLAHEGQHLIDPLRDGLLNREFRGFQVEHGFANVMGVFDPNPRTREEIAQRYGLP